VATNPTVQSADHSAGYGTATDTYSGPVPTINEGDLIDASIVANTSTNDSVTPPSGWTTLLDDGAGGLAVTGGNGYWWGWHEVTAGEAASPPASWDFVLGTARTGNVIIRRITGHKQGDPFDTAVSSTSGSFSDTVPLTIAGVTTSVDNCTLIGFANVQSGTSRTLTEPTSPGTWTEDDTTCTLSYGRGQDVAHYDLGAAGATGDVSWYQSGASLAGAAGMIAVQPASGGLLLAVTGAGGVLLGGSATVAARTEVTGSGGVLLGGAASVHANPLASVTGTGGTLLGGSAAVQVYSAAPTAGGTLLGGSASIAMTHVAPATGGVRVGGSGGTQAYVAIVAAGGTLLGGAADINANPKISLIASGGALLGGAATVARAPAVSGGLTVGGSASVTAVITVVGSGGIVLSGAASITEPGELLDFTATGGVTAAGGGTRATSSPRIAYAAGHRYWTFRYELLDLNNAFVADLDNVLGGKVSMSWLAPIKRTAEFVLRESDIDIEWLTDRIKPWIRLHLPPYGDDDWVEWPLGVFLLSSPTRTVDAAGVVRRQVTGYDQLQVLSDDKIADRYTVVAGSVHTDEVLTLLGGDFTYRCTAHSSVTRVDREWPPGTSKLSMINDLLSAINYKSLFFDEDGVAVIEPYVSPSVRTEEYTYADDETSLILPDVEQELDLFGVANSWVLVVSNPDAPALTSTYTNDNPASPTSTVRRGRTITDYREEEEAADQATLDAKVSRLALEASQVYEHVRFSTGINPLHSCNDVYRIALIGLAINSTFVETKWELPLQAGAEMTHEARRLVSI
jgi:hypothetical protein